MAIISNIIDNKINRFFFEPKAIHKNNELNPINMICRIIKKSLMLSTIFANSEEPFPFTAKTINKTIKYIVDSIAEIKVNFSLFFNIITLQTNYNTYY